MMIRRLATLLIALCVCAPTPAWARWTRLASRHFVFVGDASERDIRNIAQRLEMFREVVGRVFSDSATNTTVPTVVMVFQNDRSFTPFKPVFQGRPVAVAGYFSPGEDLNYIAVNAEQEAQAAGIIFHEYAHFLIANAVGNAPPWVGEGLAEFYETFESSNGKSATIGMPSRYNLGLLQETSTWLPVEQLIAVNHDSALYNEGDRRSLFYAQSWAFVHYLTFGAPERDGQLRKYLAAVTQGEPDAFHRVFGTDDAGLLNAVQRYVRSFRMSVLRLSFSEMLTSGDLARAEVIPDAETSGYLGDMMARLNRADDARAYLKKTVDASPDAARALAALGLLELRASNAVAALPWLERAASLAPGDASVQSAYGRALTRRADRSGADGDALFARARTALARALELEPDNVSTMVTLAEVEMGSGAESTRAVSLMQKAVAAAPGREDYRLMLAQALAMNGDYTNSSNYVGPLMARGSRPEIRDAARDLAARMATALNAVRDAAAADRLEPPDAAAASAPPSAAAPAEEPRRETAQQGVFVPTLRPVRAGETRVIGVFTAVDCRPGAIVLQVDTSAGPLRLAVPSFTEVEFLTYRQDSPGSVPCGPQQTTYRVLATFRTDAPVAGAGTPNRAVAIELLPDGFTPR
jgi:tetratricopeptide (TPR) repeat protein